MQIAEFTKECSEKWRAMNSTQKKPFEEKAAKDKARYDKEVCALFPQSMPCPVVILDSVFTIISYLLSASVYKLHPLFV